MVNKTSKKCMIIDTTVPGDERTKSKENVKIDKYEDFAREISIG